MRACLHTCKLIKQYGKVSASPTCMFFCGSFCEYMAKVWDIGKSTDFQSWYCHLLHVSLSEPWFLQAGKEDIHKLLAEL